MANQQINIPDIGDFDAVEVIEVLVAVGDEVAVDDSLLTLESDKATMEIPAPYAGKITKVMVNVGDKVSEGTTVFEIEAAEASAEAEPAESAAPAEPKQESAPSAAPQPKAEQPAPAPMPSPTAQALTKPINAQSMGATSHASPSVRAFARRLGVDLTSVTGSGPKGRIQQTDVEAAIKAVMQGNAGAASAQGGMGIPSVPEIDFSQFGETETVELGRIKKISGKFLQTSWLNVPHVTQFDECDITEMDAFRKSMKAQAEKAGVKLTPLVFVMKAVVKALQDFPNFNSSLSPDSQSLIKKHYYNIGVAVDTPNGLVVPVFRDVDKKGIYELSRELMEISGKARDGKLTPKDMSGGTFTISSLGGIGGTQFTPIVNAPEVAIMGLSKAKMQPVWNGSEFEPRLVMPFSVSYDHRVVDGAEGVRFTTTVGQYLTDLRQLIL
ncbi:MAG: dihydrolipoyllysine-residue acetyltransferase [Piscirickettsiaceae bacterium CG_4_9_14_3_um_filter_43_564]|nr:dihydrolipoyllysine-residue acetyltransferase [Thiomicrospira sp.]OIP95522.1 MAG: dihydrolipoyllysine-residue acetyltransferase [Thiomicrospira sp. CG2_30_44_34]PIQ06278.1 MAG: dihydrolipoyllysine-residue acetyltransferase [Piscirickettsiaceae bacterium CG18_big_fil_WC_8_21_14_2_50_44_103]PIU39047.1 MAG: dihydrolipoyllysine-residue acetyltransferase [Piscirickettsiaceae bacterium CG07_land_8_20_14_0_80_44_28]PIW58052.1 MAG: dihydrolipoyllysine-residue acetyltransferase [Piscirickettsiaceae b